MLPISLRNVIASNCCFLDYNTRTNLLILQSLVLLLSKYLIDMLPQRLIPMDQTPCKLFFHLRTKPQVIFFGINLKIFEPGNSPEK